MHYIELDVLRIIISMCYTAHSGTMRDAGRQHSNARALRFLNKYNTVHSNNTLSNQCNIHFHFTKQTEHYEYINSETKQVLTIINYSIKDILITQNDI